MTIYDIKRLTQDSQPYFFSRNTLKLFGQTLKDFKITKINETQYRISAPRLLNGKRIGDTVRIFDTTVNDLLHERIR